ncbi:unnamed protein product [Caenorhabditis angaria]|uniref:SUI1 domain-containing protein n=1 Tax=Caenorhabditis angaria TaxID=860376 RepID=A0A9P1IE13_9PELO|nr:unnamed protein product [Caenorhabditis angaria]
MFRKPFNVKKNTNLRNSDSRKLYNRLCEEIGNETEITVDKKSQVAQVKLVTFQGDSMNIYLSDKLPILFDFSETGNVYPTVFFMWKNPLAYPVILVHQQVLQYLENGADLMLPGVIRNDKYTFPNIRKGGPVCIALYDSSKNEVIGPIAVGCSMMSSEDMLKCGFQGKGVQILHVFRDTLWEFGPRGQPSSMSLDQFIKIETIIDENIEVENNEITEIEKVENEKINIEDSEPENSESMESLLQRCFLAGIKYRLKKSGQLPMDIGQFYTQCVLSCVPEGRKLDMKKTKYKKFGTFIQEINGITTEIVKINKKNKGAETISEIVWNHELLRSFELSDEKIVDEVIPSADKFDPPIILEFCAVTEPVLPVLGKCSKGDLLTVPELRERLTNYIKINNLNALKSVKLDPILAQVSKIKSETTDWNTLMQTIQSKMTKTWVIRWADGREFVRKINAPKIEFKIENRSGNKKVTLINNLSVFGVDIKTISHQIQTGVATSVTSQNEAVCCEGVQVIVQGNQIHFISQLLLETYGIDKKFIIGMELAPKRKR